MTLKNLSKPPEFPDQEKNRIGHFLHHILLFSIPGAFIMFLISFYNQWPMSSVILAGITIVLPALFFLNHLGYVRTASSLTIILLLSASLASAYIGDGLHDLGIVVIPLIIILASLLLNKLFFILLSAGSIILVGVVEYLRYRTFGPGVYGDSPLMEYILLTLIFGAAAVSIHLMTDHLIKTIKTVRHSEQKYRNIYENIQDIYYELAPDGTLLEVSPSHELWFDYSREEIINKPIYRLVNDPLNDNSFFKDIVKSGRMINYEIDLKNTDGKVHHVLINGTLIKDDGDIPKKIVGTIRDITEKKYLESQILQIQKMDTVGKLAGGIAHDFNNLLTIINGNSELSLMKLEQGNTDIRSDINAVLSAGHKAANLTRQLLTISKKEQIKTIILDINEILADLENMMQRLIEKNVTIQTQYANILPPVKADPVQLEQVIINLIVNARDAINARTNASNERKITLETHLREISPAYVEKHPASKAGNFIHIKVSDTGTGMPKELIKDIFDPFFTTKKNGTGLGLSTVYGIVDQNGGFIDVQSVQGLGTTFNIFWPVAEIEDPGH